VRQNVHVETVRIRLRCPTTTVCHIGHFKRAFFLTQDCTVLNYPVLASYFIKGCEFLSLNNTGTIYYMREQALHFPFVIA